MANRADAPSLDGDLGRAPTVADDPMLGMEVGRYQLTELLGEGGMGRVYLAYQPAIGSRVAVKVLLDESARNAELMERFFAEARAVNLVNHEHIVNILDLAQLPDGRPYIVMEYIEGETLSDLARGGPVSLGGLVQVMREVLSALSAAHAIGIVHRDLKPDNVRVTAEGHAKVLDFGVAKLAPALQRQRSPRTRTGALLGTPHYMAPEQISGTGTVDARTDIYAAGVVLYELATGRKPFNGETLFDLMRAHLEEAPRPPRGLRPELPAAMEQVILKALAKQPDDRYQSAAEMNEALRAAAMELPADEWCPLSATPARRRALAGAAAVGFAHGTGKQPPSRGTAPVDGRTPRAGETPMASAPTVRTGPGMASDAGETRALAVPRRRRMPWIVGGVAIAAASAGVWMFVVRGEGEGMMQTTTVPMATAPTPVTAQGTAPTTMRMAPGTAPTGTPVEPPIAPARSAPPAADAISLQLSIEPATAQVAIDGNAVRAGVLEVPRDGALHVLRIAATGYLPVEQAIRFDQSQRLVIHLKPRTQLQPSKPRATPARRERIEAKSPYD